MFRRGYERRVQELAACLGAEESNLLAEPVNAVCGYLRQKNGQPPEGARG